MLPSDEVLIQRAQRGEREAFDALYQKYKKRIFNYIYRLLGNRSIAEELTQETFVKAYINLGQYHERHTFSAWLYRIAGNTVKNEYRAQSYRRTLSLDKPLVVDDEAIRLLDTVADTSSAPDLVARGHELREAIQKVLNSLSFEHRMVLTLCDIQELSYEEVAEVLGIPVGTVASRLSRARDEFNQRLRKEYDIGKDVV